MSASIWNSFELLDFDDQGWLDSPNIEKFNDFFATCSIETIIELGSWKGRSAIFLASKLNKNGKIYCVDTWTGYTNSHKEDSFTNYAQQKPYLYQQFLSNIVHKNLTDKVIPIRMTTQKAAELLQIQADLIYIDASHDEMSVFQDIINFAPKLKSGGILCGDDYGRFPGVTEATHRAALKLKKKLQLKPPFWWMVDFSSPYTI